MMRPSAINLTATAWLAVVAGAEAQAVDPPRPAKQAPVGGGLLSNDVDDLLQRWHEKTHKVNTLYATFRRTVFDRAFRSKRENDGAARFREPNLARLDIKADEKGQGRELFILSKQQRPDGSRGLEIHHYIAAERRLQIHEFPDDAAPNAQEEGPLRLLFGIKPEAAHARYGFEIQKKTPETITVKVTPKLEADRQEFLQAVLVLDTKTFLPRELHVKENADTDASYIFTRIHTNIDTPDLEIALSDFDPPQINKKDWQITRKRIQDRVDAAQNESRRK